MLRWDSLWDSRIGPVLSLNEIVYQSNIGSDGEEEWRGREDEATRQ